MVRPKHISLPRTRIEPEIRQTGKRSFELVFNVGTPAFWVWVEAKNAEVRCSDSFFHLHPRHPRVICVECDRDLSVTDLRDGLTVFSLADTYD